MPDVSALLAQVGGSIPSGLAGSIGAINGAITNWQSQKFSSNMYKRQYRDNIAFWEKQNEYNLPANQMQRFRDAGLNPHLIYGQGNAGNAGPIPTPDVTPVQFREPDISPRVDGLSALLGQADLRIKAAQADNLETQNAVIRQDAVLRAFQAERAGYDLNFERDLTDVSADARRESLRKLKIENDVLINRDAREAAMNASNVSEAAQRMLTLIEQRKAMPLERGRIRADTDRIRSNIAIMQKDGILKDFEIALRQQGINPNDPLWARYVGMFLSDIYDGKLTPSTIAGSIWSWITGK